MIKKHVLTGFLTLLPLVLTILIVAWLFNLLTDPFAGMVERMITTYENLFNLDIARDEELVYFSSRLISLFLILTLLFLLGFIANKFFFRILLNLCNKLFLKIPLVKTLYSVLKEITSGLLQEDKKIFTKTALIPFPFPKTRAIGLITSPLPKVLQEKLQEETLSIFVPTSPHPISGFLLLTPKKDALELPFSPEEAFKFLISCGLVHPEEPKE